MFSKGRCKKCGSFIEELEVMWGRTQFSSFCIGALRTLDAMWYAYIV